MLVALRTGEHGRGRLVVDGLLRDRVATNVSLGRLNRADVAAMVDACCGAVDVSGIVDAAEGVPFFGDELLATGGRLPRFFGESVAARLQTLGNPQTRCRAESDPGPVPSRVEVQRRRRLISLRRIAGREYLGKSVDAARLGKAVEHAVARF